MSGLDQRVRERLGAQQDHERRPQEHRGDRRPPPAPAENAPIHSPVRPGAAPRRGPRQPHHVQDEQSRSARPRRTSVIECLSGSVERVERCDRRGTRPRPRAAFERTPVNSRDGCVAVPAAPVCAARDPPGAVPGDEHHGAPARCRSAAGSRRSCSRARASTATRDRARRSGTRRRKAATACPPFHAKTKSTAYSGSTAISASSASARPAEMSSCATSAAHDEQERGADDREPNSRASTAWPMDGIRATGPRAPARRRAARATEGEIAAGT